jgi:uncharacterized membrane protein YdjX (TVP38/TMEM64 family)
VTTSAAELRPAPRAPWRACAIGLGIATIVVLLIAMWPSVSAGETTLWLREAGPIGALVLGAAYVFTAVLALPIAGVTLIVGGTYGMGGGLAVALPVELFGAFVAFMVGRRYLREKIERRFADDHRFTAIDRAIGADGFRIATLLRLSPILPFGAANYALSTTSMRPGTYLAATFVGTLPGTLLYLYVGAMAKEGVGGGTETQVMWWGGLAASVIALVVITKVAREALRRAAVIPEPAVACAEAT